MSWRPMSGTDPIVYLVPVFAPGMVAAVWPAFDRWLTIATCWVLVAVIVGGGAYVGWLLWGPLPGQSDREWAEPERVRG